MRIISGKYKTKKLAVLKSNDTRPTTDKVRENIFNILGPIEGSVLDLFAGSGALGIEALSRGADEAMFIDGAKDAIGIIKENTSGIDEPVEIFRNDYRRALRAMSKRDRRFDLVFLDPPYHKGMVVTSLELIDSLDILAEGGRIVVETHKDEVYQTPGHASLREAVYGTIRINVLTKEGEL
ncbi:16S rRNA (guanine(966)-N(2))-methyltransferase RsmD [Salinicoccus hispanicus]|uniref:16S rRNA (Guanine(966)-N(2))-methyltransferase RsmD n=1 Tax=Salinicoccus hispanicus TaxID=157225 RepID=A0A6N8TYM3_9STAP|nr:16S rRNA (guanine(966)-N(2))-methyltransferase RsmD [Salinicoccus hispanicus]MXQ49786.1 16S rRNA (guanine(966)-N(2))-methyltransferase RsmD [Salinicoccus hispanicus]